jgi:hypothetical protein
MRVGIYARVSTAGGQQTTENQLIERKSSPWPVWAKG